MNNMMNYIQQSFYQACTYLCVDNMYNSTTEISNFVDDEGDRTAGDNEYADDDGDDDCMAMIMAMFYNNDGDAGDGEGDDGDTDDGDADD